MNYDDLDNSDLYENPITNGIYQYLIDNKFTTTIVDRQMVEGGLKHKISMASHNRK